MLMEIAINIKNCQYKQLLSDSCSANVTHLLESKMKQIREQIGH
jgi:hypothetical protein